MIIMSLIWKFGGSRINARAIFDQIRDDEWDDTPPKDSGKTDSPHIICINNHKPDRAEGIA